MGIILKGFLIVIDAAINLLSDGRTPVKLSTVEREDEVKKLEDLAENIHGTYGNRYSLALTPSLMNVGGYDVYLLFSHSHLYTGGHLGMELVNRPTLRDIYRINHQVFRAVGGERLWRSVDGSSRK